MPGAQCTRSLVCESGGWNAHEYSQRVHRKTPGIPTLVKKCLCCRGFLHRLATVPSVDTVNYCNGHMRPARDTGGQLEAGQGVARHPRPALQCPLCPNPAKRSPSERCAPLACAGALIYCSDHHCSHWTAISGDRWPDGVRLSDIEPRFTCQACGQRGADVRPDWHSAEAYA